MHAFNRILNIGCGNRQMKTYASHFKLQTDNLQVEFKPIFDILICRKKILDIFHRNTKYNVNAFNEEEKKRKKNHLRTQNEHETISFFESQTRNNMYDMFDFSVSNSFEKY